MDYIHGFQSEQGATSGGGLVGWRNMVFSGKLY
jgi:hypothetical protein